MRMLREQEIVSSVEKLLSYTTSDVARAVDGYLTKKERFLYAVEKCDSLVGCIGIEKVAQKIEILHLAVDEKYRGIGIGRDMIDHIIHKHHPISIQAETDKEAVLFYKSCGFSITSLGENYPGVERFICKKDLQK